MQCYIDLDFEKEYSSDELPLFFSGCDFNCPYCNTPSLLKFDEKYLTNIRDVKNHIE